MKLTRRQILGSGLVVLAAGRNGSAFPRPEASLEILDTAVVSQNPTCYHGWPTLSRRKDGGLLLVCSGGRESHVCPFGRVELMESHNGGKSWTQPRVLADGLIDDRDAGVLETAKGTMLVNWFTSLAYESVLANAEKNNRFSSDKLRRWLSHQNRTSADDRKARLGEWMIRSEDGGANWSAPYPTIVNSPHGPAQLKDGRLLYAGKQLWTGEGRIGVCESRDDGVSWQWLAEIPTRTGDKTKDYHELHVVEAGAGTIIAHIRNHNPSNNRETLQTESNDGGKTWSEPHSIGVWGLPSHLTRLSDGRLLMSYGYRRPPFGNKIRFSDDAGASWSTAIDLSIDGAGGDLGYPSTVQLDNGLFVTVWYELLKGSSLAVLRQSRWKLKS